MVLTLQTVNVIKLQIHFIFWTVINHMWPPECLILPHQTQNEVDLKNGLREESEYEMLVLSIL